MRNLLLASVVGLVLIACGAPAPAAPSPPPPTAAPSRPAEPTNPPQPSGNQSGVSQASARPTAASAITLSEARSVQQLPEVASFRFSFLIKVEGRNAAGREATIVIDATGAETRNPKASHLVMATSGVPSAIPGGGNVELFQVGDETYAKLGDQWVKAQMPNVAFMELETVLAPHRLVAALGRGQVVGTEPVGGRPATHFHYDRSMILAAIQRGAPDWQRFAGAADASVDMWVDNERKYVARAMLRTAGKQTVGEVAEGTYTLRFEVQDVNAAFTITPPPAALNASVPGAPSGGLPVAPKP